jgi:hypothetical protein
MKRFKSEDGYIFYEQPNGSLTDNPDPELADQTFDSLAALRAEVDVTELPE